MNEYEHPHLFTCHDDNERKRIYPSGIIVDAFHFSVDAIRYVHTTSSVGGRKRW